MQGGGKYESELTAMMRVSGAAGGMLMLIGGDKGNGFSVQVTPETLRKMPAMLRGMADQLEADAKRIARTTAIPTHKRTGPL